MSDPWPTRYCLENCSYYYFIILCTVHKLILVNHFNGIFYIFVHLLHLGHFEHFIIKTSWFVLIFLPNQYIPWSTQSMANLTLSVLCNFSKVKNSLFDIFANICFMFKQITELMQNALGYLNDMIYALILIENVIC